MKYTILIYATLLLLLSVVQAHAFTIDSRVHVTPQGEYVQQLTLLCESDEGALCQTVCRDNLSCAQPEPLCLNCAGTSNELMRVIFSRLSLYFEAKPTEISKVQIAAFLATKNYVLLGADSIYNFYRPYDSADIQEQFKSLCPAETEAVHLAVQLTPRGEPTRLVFAFCQINNKETKVFAVQQKLQNQTPLTMRKN